ncbi:MAG: DUF1857 family protein [Pseudazoarcus pumilus]|nr:DUF1857 family protein [Pseudazoarcus pumilus]
MKFEHVVIVNDPQNPLIEDLSREQLWFGLLCRVENPAPFLPGLEACEVLERWQDGLLRELDFGALRIRDRVTLDPMNSVTFEAEQCEQHAGGSLTIGIEEPASGQLVMRFVYRTTQPESEDGSTMYADLVRSAYEQSDIDTVRVIREIVASGRLQ